MDADAGGDAGADTIAGGDVMDGAELEPGGSGTDDGCCAVVRVDERHEGGTPWPLVVGLMLGVVFWRRTS